MRLPVDSGVPAQLFLPDDELVNLGKKISEASGLTDGLLFMYNGRENIPT